MKIVKTFMLAVAFFAMAFSVQAAPSFGGTITGPNVEKITVTSGTWLQLRVKGTDNDGNTTNGMMVNCPTCPGGSIAGTQGVSLTAITSQAATSYFDKLTHGAGQTYGTWTSNGNNLTPSAAVVIVGQPGFDTASNALRTGVTNNAQVSTLDVSRTSRVVSGPTTLNLSSVAGVAAIPLSVRFSTRGNSTVGMLWATGGNATWPYNTEFEFIGVSATAILLDHQAPGQHLFLSPTSATDITTTAAITISTEAVR